MGDYQRERVHGDDELDQRGGDEFAVPGDEDGDAEGDKGHGCGEDGEFVLADEQLYYSEAELWAAGGVWEGVIDRSEEREGKGTMGSEGDSVR